jgi:replicative DNA helicase
MTDIRKTSRAVELERAILGAMIIEPEAIGGVMEILDVDDMYEGRHRRIYNVIRSMYFIDQPVDIITVTATLRHCGDLEMVGGSHYISELTSTVKDSSNVEYHARIVSEKAILRGMATRLMEIINSHDERVDA